MGEGRAPSAESHPFPADKPSPRAAPVSRARSPVPAPRRPAAASCSTHLESVPDGRAATWAPGTDSSSQNGGGGGERGGGGARTRERAARPRQASGTERGAGGGGATARTHSHTRAPTPPPAAPRPRGRGAAAGNGATCWRLSATARAPAALALFTPSARGPASPAPTAPASPAAPGASQGTARNEGKIKCGSGCRPGLGGKPSFFSFSSPWLLPAPAQLRGLEPLGSPPRGSAARVPEGDSQPAEPQGWSAPANCRVARSVSH